MWKLIVGFIAFGALALYILTKSGGDIDLSGETHGISVPHEEAPAASEAAASEAVTAAVEAASQAASTASE